MADDKDIRRRNVGNGDIGNGGELCIVSVDTVRDMIHVICLYFYVWLSDNGNLHR